MDHRIYEVRGLTRGEYIAVEHLLAERHRQDAKFGEQNHRDGTGTQFAGLANSARAACDRAFGQGRGSWLHILREEFYEAAAESDPDKLRAELLQVAAVAMAWVEAIDRRPRDD